MQNLNKVPEICPERHINLPQKRKEIGPGASGPPRILSMRMHSVQLSFVQKDQNISPIWLSGGATTDDGARGFGPKPKSAVLKALPDDAGNLHCSSEHRKRNIRTS